MVQWLRFRVPKAGGPGSVPDQGTRCHMPQLRANVVTHTHKRVVQCYLLQGALVTWTHQFHPWTKPEAMKPRPGLCQHGGDITGPPPCSQICSHSYLALEPCSCCLPWLESFSAVMYLISRPNSNLPSSHSIACLIWFPGSPL